LSLSHCDNTERPNHKGILSKSEAIRSIASERGAGVFCAHKKGWVAEGKGRGECPAFFYVSISIYRCYKKRFTVKVRKISYPGFLLLGGIFVRGLFIRPFHLHTATIKDFEQSASLRGYLRGLPFENNEHFFDGELSAARHAVVADFMVKKDFAGRAIRAVYTLVFWFKHFLSLSF